MLKYFWSITSVTGQWEQAQIFERRAPYLTSQGRSWAHRPNDSLKRWSLEGVCCLYESNHAAQYDPSTQFLQVQGQSNNDPDEGTIEGVDNEEVYVTQCTSTPGKWCHINHTRNNQSLPSFLISFFHIGQSLKCDSNWASKLAKGTEVNSLG